MESIRMLNDGDRFYIVIENPTDNTKRAAVDFVSGLMGVCKQEETPKDVLPVKVGPYEVPKDLPEAKEQKPIKIPYIGSTKMFNEWYLKYDEVGDKNQPILLSNCRKYLNRYLRNIQREDISAISKFLTDFEPIFKNTQENILKSNGFKDLNAFLTTSSPGNIQAAYDVCKKAICQQLDIK